MTLCKTEGVDDVYFIDLLDVGYIAKVIDCSGGVKTFIGCSAAVCQVIVRPSRAGGTEVQGIARLSFLQWKGMLSFHQLRWMHASLSAIEACKQTDREKFLTHI